MKPDLGQYYPPAMKKSSPASDIGGVLFLLFAAVGTLLCVGYFGWNAIRFLLCWFGWVTMEVLNLFGAGLQWGWWECFLVQTFVFWLKPSSTTKVIVKEKPQVRRLGY